MIDAELEARFAEMQRQLDKCFSLHGLPKWEVQERQRRDNENAQGTKLPFHPTQEFGGTYRPKDHERQ
jgi:hypothetical protein